MKKQYFIILILQLILVSCLSFTEKYEKDLKDLLGEWKLKQMSYTNESGELIDCTDISSSIIFTNNNTSQNEDNSEKKGILIIEGDSIQFIYQFGFSSKQINIEVDREQLDGKPAFSFGKNQVNSFELIDDNKLLFSSDAEWVYPTNEKLTNPVYVFVR